MFEERRSSLVVMNKRKTENLLLDLPHERWTVLTREVVVGWVGQNSDCRKYGQSRHGDREYEELFWRLEIKTRMYYPYNEVLLNNKNSYDTLKVYIIWPFTKCFY